MSFILLINLILVHCCINICQITRFGSDGAKVMTGTDPGVTEFFLREINPQLFNIHFIVHKLALCSGQAAEGVPVLKDYEATLTSIFLLQEKFLSC